MDADWPRLPCQRHPGFLRRAIAFRVVARVAGSDQILPRRFPASRSRQHMVQRQATRRKSVPAVLAAIAVAQQDVFTRDRALLPGGEDSSIAASPLKTMVTARRAGQILIGSKLALSTKTRRLMEVMGCSIFIRANSSLPAIATPIGVSVCIT